MYGAIICTGTGMDWQSCPAGTYSNTEGLYAVIQCTACPGGKYCEGEHQTTWTDDCDQGMQTKQKLS